ncbi:MAG: 2-C-methyl-D-erythritol 4-phosphate cytidylyltransferase [Prolixibacteraceae bacterium]
MKKSVIIVAGGSGSRMGSEIPKQFILLENRPVLMWTMSRFIQYDPTIPLVLVLPESQIARWKELCISCQFNHPHLVVKGGETRYQSVKNGLNALGETDLVAIHDGVRPLVSGETIENCFNQADKTGAAIPVLPLNETIRTGTMKDSKTVDRSLFYAVQTPQVFKNPILQKAYSKISDSSFTDDASVVEASGFPIVMVPGNLENIKITHPSDLLIASAYLKKKEGTLL